MQGETRLGLVCAICKEPITIQQRPSKGLESGAEAHLGCYLDSIEEEDKKKRSR